jgi:DNA-binding GntR family transcriptional regulator
VTMVQPIDRDSAIPPYRQVAAQLAESIRAGKYEPGRRLPAVPDIMHEWGVAKTTAAKALQVLASQGLAELTYGMGYYVPERLPE